MKSSSATDEMKLEGKVISILKEVTGKLFKIY